MRLFLEFDAKNNVLRGTLKGRVTDAILLDSYAEAARYAKSLPPCRGIWNFSEVTEFEVSTDAIKQVVGLTPIIPTGYMRVVVASGDVHFGMMRMLQMLSEKSRPELHVVRTMDEAYRLLRVESPQAFLIAFQFAIVAVALAAYVAFSRVLNPQNLLRSLMIVVVVLTAGNVAMPFLSVILSVMRLGTLFGWVVVSAPPIVALLVGMWKANPGSASRPVST